MKGKGGGGVFEGEESLGDDGKSAIGFVGGKTRRWGMGTRRRKEGGGCGWIWIAAGSVWLGWGWVGSGPCPLFLEVARLETKKCT